MGKRRVDGKLTKIAWYGLLLVAILIRPSLRIAALLFGQTATWPALALHFRFTWCRCALRPVRITVTNEACEPLTLRRKSPATRLTSRQPVVAGTVSIYA